MWKQFITLLTYARIVVDHIIDSFFSLYWDKRRKTIPDLDKKHAILAESATSLAQKIRQKELKSEDLVNALIERIKEVGTYLFDLCQLPNMMKLSKVGTRNIINYSTESDFPAPFIVSAFKNNKHYTVSI